MANFLQRNLPHLANRLLRPPKFSLPPQPSYKESLIGGALSAGKLDFEQFATLLLKEVDWWVAKRVLNELKQETFGRQSYKELIEKCLIRPDGEVARIAASKAIEGKLTFNKHGHFEITSKQSLRVAGIISKIGRPPSLINQILSYIFVRRKTSYDWKAFFGADHRHAELMSVNLKKYRESNIDAFLVLLDSYSDLMNRVLWVKLKPGKNCPNFGNAIKDPTLLAQLPTTMACFLQIHALRLQSITAHPKSQKTGTHTRRLKHRDFYAVRPNFIKALDEIELNIII